MTRYLIFDTGSLINITQNGLIEQFRQLAKIFQGEFLVTPDVIYEAIDHPLKIKRFEWGALRIKQLLEEGVIKSLETEDIVSLKELEKKKENVMQTANNALYSGGKAITLIERGEAECLALSILLDNRGIENMVVIDERTARMICESPANLKLLMEQKLKIKLKANQDNMNYFKKIKVLRSTELMYISDKKGLLDGDSRTLEAVLYALKYGGCSISEREVEIMKKL